MLRVHDATRPLHVAEVTWRPGRFSRARPCLLVVTATAVHLLDAAAAQQGGGGGGGGGAGAASAGGGGSGAAHAAIQLTVRASEVSGGGDALLRSFAAMSLRSLSPPPLPIAGARRCHVCISRS